MENSMDFEWKSCVPVWVDTLQVAITVCDATGIILYMNEKSLKTFEKYGGEKLVGTNLLNCHPEPAKSKLSAMLASPRSNAYTIEKNGVKKLIYQIPWFDKECFGGLVELSLEIPFEMPHFIRK